MKHLLLFWVAVLFFFTATAQFDAIYLTKSEIIADMQKNSPMAQFSEGKSPNGTPFISYLGYIKDNESLLKVTYFLNPKGFCVEVVLCYSNEFLVPRMKRFNEDCVKAGKFQWVNKDGDRVYLIEPSEEIFYLHIGPLDK